MSSRNEITFRVASPSPNDLRKPKTLLPHLLIPEGSINFPSGNGIDKQEYYLLITANDAMPLLKLYTIDSQRHEVSGLRRVVAEGIAGAIAQAV